MNVYDTILPVLNQSFTMERNILFQTEATKAESSTLQYGLLCRDPTLETLNER